MPSRPPIRRYSKSSDFYSAIKSNFFESNEELLAAETALNEFYRRQPLRAHCKICERPLAARTDFVSHAVQYVFCDRCGHLNGRFDDTPEFVSRLYVSDGGREYAENYIDPNFVARVAAIYKPKVDFLLDHLPRNSSTRILDIGCGCGYFVYACLSSGIDAIGIDVGKRMVDFGNDQIEKLLGVRPLIAAGETEMFDRVATTDASVVSAIGVIEHLREPRRFFESFHRSPVRNLFFSVPMFAASAIFGSIFETVFPRQLSGAHTHLFTEASVSWMYENLGIRPIAEWRFGTDVMDLYRSVRILLSQGAASPRVIELWEEGFGSKIDELQTVLDENSFCDEIHCVTTKAEF